MCVPALDDLLRQAILAWLYVNDLNFFGAKEGRAKRITIIIGERVAVNERDVVMYEDPAVRWHEF